MDLPDTNTHSWSQDQNHTQLHFETAKENEGSSCLSFKIHFQALLWSREDWELTQVNKTAEVFLQSQGCRS